VAGLAISSPQGQTNIRWAASAAGSKSFLEINSLILLVVPISSISSALSSNADEVLTYLLWLVANLLAFALFALPVFAFRRVWQKAFDFKPLPLVLVFLISALLSFSKVFLTLELVEVLTGQDFPEAVFSSRVFAGTSSGVVALILVSLSVAILERFQAERTMLLSAKVMSSTPLMTGGEAKQIQALSESIAAMRYRLVSGAGRKAPSFETIILRELVDKYVRPLSSSLYRELDQTHQSFTARELFRTALTKQPPALALGLLYMLSLGFNTQSLGNQAGILLSTIGSVAIYVLMGITNWICKRAGIANAASFFFAGIVIPTSVVYLGFTLLDPEGIGRWIALGLMPIWYGQAAIVFAMAREAFRSAAANKKEAMALSGFRDDATAQSLLQRKRRLLANQMHGEVQSRLMGLVLKAEAGNQLDAEFVNSELEAIEALITRLSQNQGELSDWVLALSKTWDGFANIEVSLESLVVKPDAQELVYALIEEGVSNAIRHGLASEVSIRSQGGRLVVIEDNGIGPTTGEAGLGTKLLDAGSLAWSLSARERGGSRLEIELKLD
jgi:hypothetical protein